MFKKYNNFVQPSTSIQVGDQESPLKQKPLSGEEAKTIYLNELKLSGKAKSSIQDNLTTAAKLSKARVTQSLISEALSDRHLYIAVQNNNVDALKRTLDSCPDKINILDDYGWSLLMIACQANSIEVVKELLDRGIDTSIRDKAGNSAQSLIIKNKNIKLAEMLLNHRTKRDPQHTEKKQNIHRKNQEEKVTDFFCEVCNLNVTTNREIHLSSTIHNINLSKGKKIPTNYVIPESNKGYQIMLKVGWDKESGLGPHGGGKKYPLKTVQKKDRKGLGHGKRPVDNKVVDTVKLKTRKVTVKEYENNRKIEVNFRRQFY